MHVMHNSTLTAMLEFCFQAQRTDYLLQGQTDPSSSVKYLVMSTATCVNKNFSGHTKCKLIIAVHIIETNNYLTQSADTALKAASLYTQHEQSSHFVSPYKFLPSLRSYLLNPLKGTMHAQHKENLSPFLNSRK